MTLIGCIIDTFIKAFAKYGWQIYVASIFSITGFAVSTVNRSIMTKLVGPMEIGKLLAVNGVIQVCNTYLVFHQLYNNKVQVIYFFFIL